jgi:hypothetical protein
MTRLMAALVLTMIVAAGTATSFAQNSVAGDWTLTINGPQGIIDTEAIFKQEGENVTGTFSGPTGEATVAGTMNGSTLSLAFNVDTPQGPLDIKMSAEVSGPEMKGVLDFGMGTADFTGKKK